MAIVPDLDGDSSLRPMVIGGGTFSAANIIGEDGPLREYRDNFCFGFLETRAEMKINLKFQKVF